MNYVTRWKDFKRTTGGTGWRDLLRYGALSLLAASAKPQPGPSLRLVYLHNVFDDQVVRFEEQIRYLRSIGTFLTADEVLAIIRGEKQLHDRCFHLSFDDGFRNVIVNALPVLRKYEVPATSFVPTAEISADRDIGSQRVALPGRESPIEMATWDDLGKAQEYGLEIASHTRSHARFSDISRSHDRMQDEICGSKADIERELGRPCRYISWPFGMRRDADESSLEFVKNADYSGCFGAYRGQVVPRKTNPFSIPRHHFEAHWPMSHFKYFIHGAQENRPA